MKKILFIYQNDDYLNQNKIITELNDDGFEVQAARLNSLDWSERMLSGYDLAIIHLQPDARSSWGLYLDFKKHFPGFPVLAFMTHYAVKNLKSAIYNIAGQEKKFGYGFKRHKENFACHQYGFHSA